MIGSPERPKTAARPRPADFVAPEWARGPLEWRQPHWHRSEWELWAGGQPIGSLVVRGFLRERALGRGPSGDWTFGDRWTGAAWISPAGSDETAATFRPAWRGGGAITTASGLEYGWRGVGFWGSGHVIANDSGFACVRFRLRRSLLRLAGEVTIEPGGLRVPELEALVFLGWRLMVIRHSHIH